MYMENSSGCHLPITDILEEDFDSWRHQTWANSGLLWIFNHGSSKELWRSHVLWVAWSFWGQDGPELWGSVIAPVCDWKGRWMNGGQEHGCQNRVDPGCGEHWRQERQGAENQAGQQGIAGKVTAMNTGIALASVAASPLSLRGIAHNLGSLQICWTSGQKHLEEIGFSFLIWLPFNLLPFMWLFTICIAKPWQVALNWFFFLRLSHLAAQSGL